MLKLFCTAFFLWVTVFMVSFLIFPLKTSNPLFFETLISIVLTGVTILYGHIYFKREVLTLKKCVFVGVVWVGVNLVIDLPLFLLNSPMKMEFGNYMTDIGLTYLMIPLILMVYAYRREGI